MKSRALILILTLVLFVLIVIGSCATRKIAISDEDLVKAYTGTWINEEYDGEEDQGAKIVMFADGTWERYEHLDTDKYPVSIINKGRNTILDQWKDSEGNIWFESSWECIHRAAGYQLTKISDSGNTLEMLFTSYEHRVEEWDPDDIHYTYRIYYRQE